MCCVLILMENFDIVRKTQKLNKQEISGKIGKIRDSYWLFNELKEISIKVQII